MQNEETETNARCLEVAMQTQYSQGLKESKYLEKARGV